VNGSPVMTGTYNELDQLISDGTKQYSYDRRGNLTQITGGTKYKWDGADRLISATVGANTATYTYDNAGRRVKQIVTSPSPVTTNFLWDEMSPYGDVVYESDGTTATNYTLGNGELISQKRGSNSTEYFLMDGYSGVRSLVGSSTQNYNYDAFGNLQNFSGTPNTKYLYTGQQFDSLTSLYDLRARYYNPGQGRFLIRDVAEVNFKKPTDFNRYGYTANNPVNNYDPSGLDTVSLGLTLQKVSANALVIAAAASITCGILRTSSLVASFLGADLYSQNISHGPYGNCIGRAFVADSNIFMDRVSGDRAWVDINILQNPNVALYVPLAAEDELWRSMSIFQLQRLLGLPPYQGALRIPVFDGEVTDADLKTYYSPGFNQADMKIVQTAIDRNLPLLSFNGDKMRSQIVGNLPQGRAARFGAILGAGRILVPPLSPWP